MKHLYLNLGLVVFALSAWNLNGAYANTQSTELKYAAVQSESVKACEQIITISVCL
jgi:hypothetical protein